jgi:hypothetical protein
MLKATGNKLRTSARSIEGNPVYSVEGNLRREELRKRNFLASWHCNRVTNATMPILHFSEGEGEG